MPSRPDSSQATSAVGASVQPPEGATSRVARLGAMVLDGVAGTGRLSILFGQTIAALFQKLPRRRVLLMQMYQIGNLSLPVILTTGAFTGMVLAAQSYFSLKGFKTETMVGALVGISLVKELGPVLTGLMLAGRVGASIAAELGTMKVTEQIEALETLATDPVHYLVLPRFLSCILLTPILTVICDVVGMVGGYVVGVDIYGIDKHYYIANMIDKVTAFGIIVGLVKAFVFGGIIAMVSCYKGFNARGGAEGVGRATYEAVVTSCMLILVSNFFLTLFMQNIHTAIYG